MLTPDELAKIQEHLVPLYQELEDFIIEDIARRLKKTGQVTDMAKWQIEMANDIAISMKKIEDEVARINEIAIEEVERLFNEAALTSLDREVSLYEKAGMSPLTLDTDYKIYRYIR